LRSLFLFSLLLSSRLFCESAIDLLVDPLPLDQELTLDFNEIYGEGAPQDKELKGKIKQALKDKAIPWPSILAFSITIVGVIAIKLFLKREVASKPSIKLQPDIKALISIIELKKSLSTSERRRYAEKLDGIVKEYIGDKCKATSFALTTEELLVLLAQCPAILGQVKEPLIEFLKMIDREKFS